jgi:hypothetical protein
MPAEGSARSPKEASPAGLAVGVEVADPVVVGLSAPALIRVTNHGPGPATISSRLNLFEGDLRLIVTQPDGTMRHLKGWQADTPLHRVTLAAGEHVEAGINLLSTGSGPAFPSPGSYVLRAEYDPSPAAETVVSAPVTVAARSPQTEPERGVADLLKDEAAREALVRADADAAREKFEALSQRYGETLDGKLARLLLFGADKGGDAADPLQLTDPMTLARWITMLSTPYNKNGAHLADQFVARFELHSPAVAASKGKAEDSALLEKALRVVKRLPLGK